MADAISTTLSGLRSTSSPLATTIYQTTDYGGGHWYYDPSDTTTVDNTGLVVVSGAGARFKRIYGESINAAWFRDPALTDTVVLNNTLNAAMAIESLKGACTIIIDAIYTITGTSMNIPQNANLLITGNGTLKRGAGYFGAVVHIVATTDGSEKQVTFRDINFDGNLNADPSKWSYIGVSGDYRYLYPSPNTTYFVYADETKNISFENCNFFELHGTAIMVTNSHSLTAIVSNLVVHNCRFKDIQGESAVYTHGFTACSVTQSHFENIGVLPDTFIVINDGVETTGAINDANRYAHQFGDGVTDNGTHSYIAGNTFINCNRISCVRDVATDQGITNATTIISGNYILSDSPNLVCSNPPAGIWVEHSANATIADNIIEIKQRGRETNGSFDGIRFNETNENYAKVLIHDNRLIADLAVDYLGNEAALYVGIFSINVRSYSKVSIHHNQITGRFMDGIYIGNSETSNIDTEYLIDNNHVDIYPNPTLAFECSALKLVPSFVDATDAFPIIISTNNFYRTSLDGVGNYNTTSWKRCIYMVETMPVAITVSMIGDNINYGSISLCNNIAALSLKNLPSVREIVMPSTSFPLIALNNIYISGCEIRTLTLAALNKCNITNNNFGEQLIVLGGTNVEISNNTIQVYQYGDYSMIIDLNYSNIINMIIKNNTFQYVGSNAKYGINLKRTNASYTFQSLAIINNVHVAVGQTGSVGMHSFDVITNPAYVYFTKAGNLYYHLATNELGF